MNELKSVMADDGHPPGREGGTTWWKWHALSGGSYGFHDLDLDGMLVALTRRDKARAEYYGVELDSCHQWGILAWWAASWGQGWCDVAWYTNWIYKNQTYYKYLPSQLNSTHWLRWRDDKWIPEDDKNRGKLGAY